MNNHYFSTKTKESISSCDLQLWLNYRDQNSYNRVVIKKCDKNNDDDDDDDADDDKKKKSSYSCQGCKRTMSSTQLNQQVSWTLVANFESKMLNYQSETYEIVLKTNMNDTYGLFKRPKLRPFWQQISFPSLKFTFEPKTRCLSCSATCFNDPHCSTFDNK